VVFFAAGFFTGAFAAAVAFFAVVFFAVVFFAAGFFATGFFATGFDADFAGDFLGVFFSAMNRLSCTTRRSKTCARQGA
jgi:hypothetical protein